MPDEDKREPLRPYGAADPDSITPPAPGGMRGEGSAPLTGDTDNPPIEEDAEGQRIAVKDVSGVAYAEDSGRTGMVRDQDGSA